MVGVPERTDLGSRLQKLERELGELQRKSSLHGASISEGNLTIKDGGSVIVQDEGDVVIKEDGSLIIEGGGGIIATGSGDETAGSSSISVFHPNGELGVRIGTLRSNTFPSPTESVVFDVNDSNGNSLIRIINNRAGSPKVFIGGSSTAEASLTGNSGEGVIVNPQFLPAEHGVHLNGGSSNGIYMKDTGTTGGAANLNIATDGRVRESTSSRRFKQDIQDYFSNIESLLKLRPRTWRDKGEVLSEPLTTKRYVGLIAEEVDDLGLQEFLTFEENGETPRSVNYDRLSVGLLAIIQDQHEKIDLLTRRVDDLESKPDTGSTTND